MLSPNDRALLLESVRPPPGYRLDHALITTYSLNLTAALSVPLALTFHDWEESDDGRPHVDPVGLLEALRSNAKRLTILCQAGEIAVPEPQRNLFAFLEPAVIPVTAPLGGIFHPKAWILRYAPDDPDDEPIRYRLLCASRNLTFDRSWDVLLALDGSLDDAEAGDARAPAGTPLARFVTGLRGMAARSMAPLSDRREAALALIEDEIAGVRFEPPERIEEVRFHPLGIDEDEPDPFEGRRDRMLVISPFVGSGCVERLAAGERSVVISTQAELDAVGPTTLEAFDEVKVLTDLANPEPLDPDESTAGRGDPGSPLRLADSADGLLRGLHAKVYVADAGWRARIWAGSANATHAAFSTNVELLVELEGKKSSCGVEAILGDGEGGLRSLLEPYRPSDDSEGQDQRDAERLADSAAHALGAAPLELHVVRAGNGAGSARFALKLRAPEGLPKEVGAVEARVWPITLSDDRARPLESEELAACRWEQLEAEQVTAFLGVAIAARVGDAAVERRVTMRTLLIGVPGDRDGAIIRSILSSPERLLRYLAFLLADLDADPASAVGMMGLLGPEPGATEPSDAAPVSLELPLLEGMVRALARDPQRIDRVEQLIREISASEHTRALLPDGFEAIFEPIRIARERLGRNQ